MSLSPQPAAGSSTFHGEGDKGGEVNKSTPIWAGNESVKDINLFSLPEVFQSAPRILRDRKLP